jgi:SAM-dependent methyltransferase
MLEPHYAKAHNGVGIALKDQGRLDEAAASFRAAVSLKPDYIEALNNLGNVLRDLEHPTEATGIYRKALELGSGSAYLWHNIGSALRDLGAFSDAAEACRRALALEPDFAEARSSLGDALFALGQPDEAAANYACALRVRETPESIAGFVRSFVAAELRCVDGDVRAIAIRAISVPWSRPARLAMACIRVVANGAEIRACIDRSWEAWPSRLTSRQLFRDIDRDAVYGDLLLRTLLENAPVCDLQMERFLTTVRHALLNDAMGETGPSAPRLAFACALARQCFINDYVYSYTAPEIDQAHALQDRLAASLRRGDVPPAMTIAVACAYFPLLSIVGAESLVLRGWPEPVAALLEQQLREPVEERILGDRIPRLTALDDEVSIRVRRQYEEHPYPKWVKLPPSGLLGFEGADPVAGLRRLRPSEQTPQPDILIAGCGTGQESIEVAQQFPSARVLAVDLSLASLAYAVRKAREMRIDNVDHAQADLSKLGSLGRKFDIIYSVGVLHHLADPMRGWRELVSLLAADGRMLVGLYSERSRQDVTAARAFIAERGYASTATDIRRCRQDLMSFERGAPFSRLASRADFYVTGECRDLLFHVRELQFTLPEIRRNLEALGLRFDGFVLDPQFAKRYAERYRSGTRLENLEDWEAFEVEFPDAFAGMYIFWVQKLVKPPVGSSYPESPVTSS